MRTLNYGKIRWSYDGVFDPSVPCRPSPFLSFSPIKIAGSWKKPDFSERTCLQLLKHRAAEKVSFPSAYKEWYVSTKIRERDLGEGRSFLQWLKKNDKAILLRDSDVELHPYFKQENAPRHSESDDFAKDLSFSVTPVEVSGRKVKLYLQDDAILNLISMPYGHDTDFKELLENYVALRFQWEEWRAPAPPFLDWVKSLAKRPVFRSGQLGFCL